MTYNEAGIFLLALTKATQQQCSDPDGHILYEDPMYSHHWCFKCRRCHVVHVHVHKVTKEVT